MWAPQQAARARQRASLASNRRRGRRIRRGRFRTYYRVSGPCSSVTAADRDGRLPLNGPPKQGKKPAKAGGSPIFRGIGRHYRVRRNPAFCARRSGTLPRVESNRPVGAVESISRDFDAAPRQTHGENSLPGLAARRPCRLLSVIETAEPGNMRLDARYAISAARGECAPRRRP